MTSHRKTYTNDFLCLTGIPCGSRVIPAHSCDRAGQPCKKMPTRALEKYTRVKQIDNRVIKVTTTRLERCPLIRKTKKRIINNSFQMTSDVRDIRCFLSDLSSIDRLIELASNLVPFKACCLYLFILLRFENVFI